VGDLQLAILSEDAALLTAVPGSRKAAGRPHHPGTEGEGGRRWNRGGSGCRRRSWTGESEVVAALLALGYSAGEARQASRDALMDPTIARVSRIASRRPSGPC